MRSEHVAVCKLASEEMLRANFKVDTLKLPPGYFMDESDPDITCVCRPGGEMVARFYAYSATTEEIERAAGEDYQEYGDRLA